MFAPCQGRIVIRDIYGAVGIRGHDDVERTIELGMKNRIVPTPPQAVAENSRRKPSAFRGGAENVRTSSVAFRLTPLVALCPDVAVAAESVTSC
jgi:hypothetical protein